MANTLWRIEWTGDNLTTNAAGTFQKYTTAYVDEQFACNLVGQTGWLVSDPAGNPVGGEVAVVKPIPANFFADLEGDAVPLAGNPKHFKKDKFDKSKSSSD